ncbi:RNA methyltransferase [Nocardia puris]|uniref:TrmH family RNA methyltransferase n=1 Tax=Nocardia puris TaxID=208602 RepID=UPI0018938EF1|nr:RNA methyltransferase [Nocardia puris]MBF6213352.1 RNA methyltransferase [Nocardia puris]MBF6369480.1 RNA methyltransferase [Nocardia puris]MBF6462231.1 RNA methyltransferase [Nocardia puris]
MTTRHLPERPADALSERNPRVVSAVKLHRAAQRRKTGQFLAEGANAVTAALETGRVRELFYSAAAAAREHELVASAAASGVRTTLVSDRAAEHLGETVTAPGLVAVCDVVDVPLADILGTGPRMLAVPVEIAEPGNAGTLIRVADAVGADGVLLAGDTVDPHNGKCVRASAGSLFHVPIARERDVTAALDALAAAGVTLLATTATGELDLDDADEVFAGPVAWLFGNEAHGLDPAVAARADHRVRIPIHGRAESLNLAAAAAICLYAGARVRHAG